jgi:hypothetical protein
MVRINLKQNLFKYSLLEKITATVQLAVPGVAFLAEDALTFATLHALHMPRLIQHIHQVTLHYRLLATATHKWGHHLLSYTPRDCKL